jgi:mannitol 2-dehydrogenase
LGATTETSIKQVIRREERRKKAMKESVQLNQENLRLLSEEIVRPKYDRSRIKAGIVHIGVGGFHRSHEAHYTDELMGAGDLAEWGSVVWA